MTVEKAAEFAALFEAMNRAELTRKITAIQTRLINLAKDKTKAITACPIAELTACSRA